MINRVESYIEFTYFQSSDENLGTLLRVVKGLYVSLLAQSYNV